MSGETGECARGYVRMEGLSHSHTHKKKDGTHLISGLAREGQLLHFLVQLEQAPGAQHSSLAQGVARGLALPPSLVHSRRQVLAIFHARSYLWATCSGTSSCWPLGCKQVLRVSPFGSCLLLLALLPRAQGHHLYTLHRKRMRVQNAQTLTKAWCVFCVGAAGKV